MGGASHSKQWRELSEDHEKDLDFLNKFVLKRNGAKHVRVLLLGQIGAGKSAFINSVNSVVNGRITNESLADGVHGSSFTKKYATYKIQTDEKEYPFVFNDTMGLEDAADRGVHVDDIIMALKGHVRDGYEFNPEEKITEEHPSYNAEPTINDKVHVLVSVVPADKVDLLPANIVRKMRRVRLAARDLGIPQMAILTRIDEAIERDENTNIYPYSNKTLQKKVDKFSVLLGLPPNCIFLVQNYHSEYKLKWEMNALLVCALRQMITSGKDFINRELVQETANSLHEY